MKYKILENNNLKKQNEIRTLLMNHGLKYEDGLDFTIYIEDNNQVIGTISKTENVIKCLAVDEKFHGLGLTNELIKMIEDKMFEESFYHYFAYSPNYNRDLFTSFGFKQIISVDNFSLFESGRYSIENYLLEIKKQYQISDSEKAAIVINGNPFTKGHLHLIERASKENREVLVFVVEEDKSIFPFEVRYQLICDNVKHLNNVSVVNTGPYIVSNAIFPSYFVKTTEDALDLYLKFDNNIFGQYYGKIFNINKRYVGEEPFCQTTRAYNIKMKEILPKYNVEVIEIKRLKDSDIFISASKVRELLKEGNIDQVQKLVPDYTYQYLISNEASTIIDKLKTYQKRH